jgi:hypothetical protein
VLGCLSGCLPTSLRLQVLASCSFRTVGLLGPAVRSRSSSDGYAQTCCWKGASWARKKLLVRCGLAAICGVVEVLDWISRVLWRCLVMLVSFAAVSVTAYLGCRFDGVSMCQCCANVARSDAGMMCWLSGWELLTQRKSPVACEYQVMIVERAALLLCITMYAVL